ncbi:MAG: dihydroorotase [Candidatus Thermoplasmatota archaeon]|nr:dihydroorotase [Candidatus Thermoplasmatota archaeon]
MAFDTILVGKFYFQGQFRELEVGIRNGRIEKIGKDLKGGIRKELEGAIFPAGTDTHVHFRDPGETQKEDFSTGTISAAFGGTTTIFDMPNNKTPVLDYVAFDNKLHAVQSKAYVDFGLYSMFTGKNSQIIDKRSSSIKIFLGGSTNSLPVDDFPDKELKGLRELDKPVVFHGEDAACLERHKKEYVQSLAEHELSRPELCETEAAKTILNLGIGRSLMGHISTPDSLEILQGKVKGEVTPHNLLLNVDSESGTWGKVNPPLRSRETQEKNLQAYLNGKFDLLSSDHAPHTEHDKEEFPQAASGIIGVETRIPLLLALVQKKVLSFEVFYNTAIKNPAEYMGISKGKLEVGYFADFFSFKPSNIKKLNQERLHSKTPVSPFNEFPVVFPDDVTLRGEFLIESGELVEDRIGRHVDDLK